MLTADMYSRSTEGGTQLTLTMEEDEGERLRRWTLSRAFSGKRTKRKKKRTTSDSFDKVSTMQLLHQLFILLAIFPLIFSSSHHDKPRGSKSVDSSQGPCDGIPIISSNRRACGFFIWDAPSALFYRWCNHLLKDYLYEGLGGHMVRHSYSVYALSISTACTVSQSSMQLFSSSGTSRIRFCSCSIPALGTVRIGALSVVAAILTILNSGGRRDW